MKLLLNSSLYTSFALASVLALASCGQKADEQKSDVIDTSQKEAPVKNETVKTDSENTDAGIASIKTAIACLPEQAALIAAHRGISEDWDLPENSASGLQRLMDENYLVAEIDVASTKDGTLFLFHDGVWDETSTGQGPVSATSTYMLNKILLKSRKGTLASERPLHFDQALDMAKDKLYLEIDFKSSAPEAKVIEAIKAKNMGDQVILISYTSEQAEELQALAPNMVLSAPGEDNGKGLKAKNTLLWMGRDIASVTDPTNTLGYIGMIGHKSETAEPGPRQQGKLLVTDFPSEFPPILGLSHDASEAYETCLTDS